MRLSRLLVFVLLGSASVASPAQGKLAYSGCEAPPEVRSALERALSGDSLVKLKVKERDALQERVIGELMAKYPRDYFVNDLQFSATRDHWYEHAEEREAATAALRDRWTKDAQEHPDDALAMLMAGKALLGKNTPEAIRLMEAAKAKAPEFPWPAHELVEVYSFGKFPDDAKVKENLERFYSLCPAWTANDWHDNREGLYLQKHISLVAKTAVALRASLKNETDPFRLKAAYPILWQREFLTRPPSEHDAQRAQVVADVKRLEALNPNGDAAWRAFLIEGYRLSGARDETLDALKDRLLHDFPHSTQAEAIVWQRTGKDPVQPTDPKDAAAWKQYYQSQIDLTKKLMPQFPDDTMLQRSALYSLAHDDKFVSKEEGIAALDLYLKAKEDYGGAGMMNQNDYDPAWFLMEHDWQPERAMELLKKCTTYTGNGHSKREFPDHVSEDDRKRFERWNNQNDLWEIGLFLKAAKLAGKPDEALKLRQAIEEPAPADKDLVSDYWWNRGRFAALQNHPADALIYYRLALDTRTRQPEYRRGYMRDEVMEEFKALWKAQGGTDAGWTAWNPPVSEEKAEAKKDNAVATSAKAAPEAKDKAASDAKKKQEGDWEEVAKQLPAFELSDFAGKTWRQKDLEGKVVVAVSWATWCGPCRLQDQLLEKFYEKVKDRKDVLILSLNVDDNPGQVQPFMRSHGYTFPVLAAFSYEPASARNGVPKTWIIDPHGKWRWMKDGYDDAKSYAEFEKEMLERIDKAKAGM